MQKGEPTIRITVPTKLDAPRPILARADRPAAPRQGHWRRSIWENTSWI